MRSNWRAYLEPKGRTYEREKEPGGKCSEEVGARNSIQTHFEHDLKTEKGASKMQGSVQVAPVFVHTSPSKQRSKQIQIV